MYLIKSFKEPPKVEYYLGGKLAKAAYSSSTLHNVDQLTDFSVYIERDKFCLIIARERKRHGTRHKRDRLSCLDTPYQRVWRPFLFTASANIYSIYSCPA